MTTLPALGWGSLGALSWGLSALSWTVAIRRGVTVWPMLLWVFVCSLITAAGAAIAVEGAPTVASHAILGAIGAGLLYAIGDAFFFWAVDAWQVTLVTPIVACSGAVSAGLAVLAGDRLAAVTVGGLALMVVGLITVATRELRSGGRRSQARRPLGPMMLAAGAACAFGLVFFVSGRTAGGDPLWLVAIARAAAIPLVAALCVARQGLAIPPQAWPWVVSAGFFDATGYAAFIQGSRFNLPIAAITTSQYAGVTVIGGVLLLRERFSLHQIVGVMMLVMGAAVVAGHGGG